MVIRVSEIPDQGLRIDSVADLADALPEEGFRLDAVDVSVERRGTEVVVTGGLQATARLQCSRCLEPVAASVAPVLDLHLLPAPSVRHERVELGLDDLELDFYQGDTLDLGRLLHSETHLALPMKHLCRDDCRGLCPICGGNRNLTVCACEERRVDPRLASLEALRRLR